MGQGGPVETGQAMKRTRAGDPAEQRDHRRASGRTSRAAPMNRRDPVADNKVPDFVRPPTRSRRPGPAREAAGATRAVGLEPSAK
jgi:hypothetical protein